MFTRSASTRCDWRYGCLLAVVGAAGWAWAQGQPGPVPAPSEAAPDAGLRIADLFVLSPLINSLILALSVLAVVLFVYFMLTVKTHAMAPPRFIDEVNKLVRNRDFKEAADYCRDHAHLFSASVVQRCVENTDKPHSVLMGMIDSEGRRRADIIWNRISYVADVANVAPMLGLLGTVLGMVKAFSLYLPDTQASITATRLSAAVGGAMATTLFGLAVGILALVFHAIIKGRVTQALAETEQIVHSIADTIKRGET